MFRGSAGGAITGVLAMTLSFAGATAAGQTTWRVDIGSCDPDGGDGTSRSPFCSIQDAIDVASAGDEILVAPGVYMEHLDFLGKLILVRSLAGPTKTIIDGNGQGSVVTFAGGESRAAILDGFTITGGTGTIAFFGSEFLADWFGGGIYIEASSPTIRYNVIIGNVAGKGVGFGGGGGVFCYGGSPLIEHNLISGNDGGSLHAGGGIYAWASAADIVGNTIEFNIAAEGAGIAARKSPGPAIVENTIRNGFSYYAGGGIALLDGAAPPLIALNVVEVNEAVLGGGIAAFSTPASTRIERNEIRANTVTERGGGIYLEHGEPKIVNNLIASNGSAVFGGGVSVIGGAPWLLGNLISGNEAQQSGGGVSCRSGALPTLTNNTIVSNVAGPMGAGGGVNANASFPRITNAIVWGNVAAQGAQLRATSGGLITVTTSNVQGGASGQGNIQADPKFRDAAQGDFRLEPNSPCLAAGRNDHVPGWFDTDLDGQLRIVNGVIDMGCYEFQRPVVIGDLNGDGVVNVFDLLILLSTWGTCEGTAECDADLDNNGVVDMFDLLMMLSEWG